MLSRVGASFLCCTCRSEQGRERARSRPVHHHQRVAQGYGTMEEWRINCFFTAGESLELILQEKRRNTKNRKKAYFRHISNLILGTSLLFSARAEINQVWLSYFCLLSSSFVHGVNNGSPACRHGSRQTHLRRSRGLL